MIYLPASIGRCLSRGTGSWCWTEKTQDLNHCHFPTPVKKKKLFQTPSITQIVSNYSVLEVNVRNHLHNTIYPIIWQWYWMLLETFWSSKVKYANNKGIQIYSIFVNFVTCLETQRYSKNYLHQSCPGRGWSQAWWPSGQVGDTPPRPHCSAWSAMSQLKNNNSLIIIMDSKSYLSLKGEQELSFLSWKQFITCGVMCNI